MNDEIKTYTQLMLLYGRTKAQRQLQILELLVRAFNSAGVTPLLLKGSAAHAGGVYPDPGFRQMADIDLLVPSEHFETCIKAAEELGFEVDPSAIGQAGHALPLRNHNLGLLLEIHHRLARIRERDNFPAAMVLEAAQPAEFRGTRVLLPHWSHHASLTILHAVAWDRSRHMALVPLRALLDLAALKASGVPICWSEVQEQLEGAGERTSLIHAETLFCALFSTPLTGIEVSEARRRRILRYYAFGAAHPRLHHYGLAVGAFRKRFMRLRRQPARVLQLLRPGFYRRLASDSRRALRADTPLH
jgi:hypothetical protein